MAAQLLATLASDFLTGANLPFVASFLIGLLLTLLSILGLGHSDADADVHTGAEVDHDVDIDHEVDVDTGVTDVRRFYALDDCGTRINPMIIEGQVHGGLTEALAIAMGQEIAYDELGNVSGASLLDFFLPTAVETPSWETDWTTTPSPHHPIGAKGVGESPNVGGVSAFSNAVNDAFVPEGATFLFAAPTRRRGGPVYELGVIAQTAAGHAGFAMGVTRRALDELTALSKTKVRMGAGSFLSEDERFLHALGTLESRYHSACAWVRETFGAIERRYPDQL